MVKLKGILGFVSPQVVIFSVAVILPACEGFVCSQERIKAIELANRGAEEFRNNLYDTAAAITAATALVGEADLNFVIVSTLLAGNAANVNTMTSFELYEIS